MTKRQNDMKKKKDYSFRMNKLYYLNKESNESSSTSFKKRDDAVLFSLRKLKEEVFKTKI